MKEIRGAVLAFVGCLCALGSAQTSQNQLEQGFRNPPPAAEPRTWWHWTNGNVSESGITKDLEWMHRVGIGGFQLVDVGSGSGQSVEKKILYGSPEWFHAVQHSATQAKKLGLEMSIFSSPGWSEAGGPWVKPEQAMKRLVWSETKVEGGVTLTIPLPKPPSNEGPVRDLVVGSTAPGSIGFYGDSAIIAFRSLQAKPQQQPKITTSQGPLDSAPLLDSSLNTTVHLRAEKDGHAWLQYEFSAPFTARAFTIGSRGGIPVGRLSASDDGIIFHTITLTPGPQGYHGAPVRTFAFAATTARYFRFEIEGAGLKPAAIIHGEIPIPAPEYVLSEAILHSEARVNRWEDKGAFGSLMNVYESAPTPSVSMEETIPHTDILDLTSKMDSNGVLHWDAPAGHWTILRLGYALTGAKNRPAPPSGQGYEVDKLDAEAVRSYLTNYIDPLRKQLGPALAETLHYMTMDSWEAGMQNWTPSLIQEFQQRRGYSPIPYLAVLTGRVVDSSEDSDRFLWDFRRTLADLFAENFYGTMEAELKKRGMESYGEASGVALEIPEDTLLNKSKVDIPMAEFWVKALHPESMYFVDVRGAASAAHVYGKKIAAAEAYTGGGYESPLTLKRVADYWFSQGINRLVFHTSAHQPLDTKPGNTMVGAHLNRNITWAEQAKPLMTYFARVSYLLQQGDFVADIAYLLPEGAPATMPFWESGLRPAPPAGYDYDYLNFDILQKASVSKDGAIILPSGSRYRLLVLPPTKEMTPKLAAKLKELVTAGATVLGERPMKAPSLTGRENSAGDLKEISYNLWGDTDGVTNIQHYSGRGRLYSGLSVEQVLERLKTPQDVTTSGTLTDTPTWIHRRLPEADIYFLVNRSSAEQTIQARFRCEGKQVSLWNPATGIQNPANYQTSDGFTTVSMHLAPWESVFVVFRKEASNSAPRNEEGERLRKLFSLDGNWKLSFPSAMGAPNSVALKMLDSWTNSADAGVKYFSGTATYTKDLIAPASWFRKSTALYLDLGKVGDLAEVFVNGNNVGILWAPPYRVEISKLLRPGKNHLEIRVTNEWTNRLIGDRLVPEKQRILSGGSPVRGGGIFGGEPELVPSGLLTEVSLFQATRAN